MKAKYILAPVGSFVGSAIIAFGLMGGMVKGTYKNKAGSNSRGSSSNIEQPISNQQKLLNSALDLKGFEVKGELDFTLEDSTKFNIDIDVKGDISELENVAVKGDLALDMNGLVIPANISYFDSTLYFSYRENYFSLETAHIMDFVTMLPDYGINISIPEELTNLDINTISSLVDGMEEVKGPNDEINFVLSLSDDISLYVKTDATYTIKGIRTDHINFNGTEIYLNLDLVPTDLESLGLISPLSDGSYIKYQKFEPVFNLFKGLVNTFRGKNNTIELSVDLSKKEEELVTKELSASLDFSYELNNKNYTILGKVDENERHHEFAGGYVSDKIFVDFNDLKIQLKDSTTMSLIQYLINQIGSRFLDDILSGVSSMLEDIDIEETISKADSILGDIKIIDDMFSIDLDTDAVDLGVGTLTPKIFFTEEGLEKIELKGIGIKNTIIDVEIKVVDYSPITFVEEQYVEFEPALTLVDAIFPLIDKTQFRLEFDSVIKDSAGVKDDVLIGGGLQFDIENSFGYGDVTITDRDEYHHTIKADMRSPENIIFSYNDAMKGKFKAKTLTELFGLVMDIVINPDDHFVELFGDIIEFVKGTPIYKVIDGDYGLAFSTDLLQQMSVTEDSTKLVVPLDIIGFSDKTMDLELFYSRRSEKAYIDGLSINMKDMLGMDVEFNINLKEFDESLENQRLNPVDEYLDFSDIKVLLEFGINTSKFDYYHFTASLDINIPLFSFDPIDLDIKIRNDHGKVKISVDFLNVPTLPLFSDYDDYLLLLSRESSLYYEDGIFYIKRHDVTRTLLVFGTTHDLYYSTKMDGDYFLDNILTVIFGDILGFKADTLSNLFNSSSSSSTKEQIKYEEILKSFVCDNTKSKFTFKINLNTLTHMSMLDTADLVVSAGEDMLNAIDVSLTLHVLVNIKVSLNLKLVNSEPLLETNQLVDMDSWISSVINDEINTRILKSDTAR